MDTQIFLRPKSNSYKLWQSLFILGCIFSIGLTFVPSMIVKVEKPMSFYDGFSAGLAGRAPAPVVEEKLMSTLDLIRKAFQMGQSGLALLAVSFFAAYIALLVMAVVYQKRWVFITGASLVAFGLLMNLFSPSNPNIEHLLITQVIGYIATFFMLSGFIAKPPVSIPRVK